MKKYLSIIAMMSIIPTLGMAATNSGMRGASSADLAHGPAVRERVSVDVNKYETRTNTRSYFSKPQQKSDIYYTAPAKRHSDIYRSGQNSETITRTTRTETARTEAKRKYYLAHPFFQPTAGKFGSITDISYTSSSYDISFLPYPEFGLNDDKGAWWANQLVIKEDLSYGITDRFAVLGLIRYANTKSGWDDIPEYDVSDSGIDFWGLGGQWRFVDNTEWIATATAQYQKQVDVANNIVADIKAGYKINMTTLYGLIRGRMTSLEEGDSYGNGVAYAPDNQMFIAYNSDAETFYSAELGAGVFSVLDEDWTLNVEAIFGNYDWHNQAFIKGAIGWQPGNSFALNLYAQTAFYDSADGKDMELWWYSPATGIDPWTQVGIAKPDNVSDFTIGVQAILYF